jgi:Adenylate and Guanylate cyclase catalytic domain
MYEVYSSSWPRMLITGAVLTIFTLFLTFLFYDMQITHKYTSIREEQSRFYSVVGALFPRVVLNRVLHEAAAFDEKIAAGPSTKDPTSYNDKIVAAKNKFLADCRVPVDTSGSVTGGKPIYNSFPHTTICFLDIAGFTSWCSERDPEQVFNLLEATYQVFDQIAVRLKVFKIETIGDCYVAATGVPEYQSDHCLVMIRFVYEAMASFIRLAKAMEKSLGPGTGDLAIRAGVRK